MNHYVNRNVTYFYKLEMKRTISGITQINGFTHYLLFIN